MNDVGETKMEKEDKIPELEFFIAWQKKASKESIIWAGYGDTCL